MFLEILGFIVGVIYLWWEYHADARVWLASVVMPAISMWIYFSKGIYADFAINIYYLVIAAYGYWAWTRRSRREGSHPITDTADASDISDTSSPSTDVSDMSDMSDTAATNKPTATAMPITRLSLPLGLVLTVVLALLWMLLAWLLVTFTDSTVPYWDAFTTALSIVALWMMARKIAEQWLAWLIVDAVCVYLYAYKGLVFYPILYAIYTVIAWAGYRKWLRLMHQQ